MAQHHPTCEMLTIVKTRSASKDVLISVDVHNYFVKYCAAAAML